MQPARSVRALLHYCSEARVMRVPRPALLAAFYLNMLVVLVSWLPFFGFPSLTLSLMSAAVFVVLAFAHLRGEVRRTILIAQVLIFILSDWNTILIAVALLVAPLSLLTQGGNDEQSALTLYLVIGTLLLLLVTALRPLRAALFGFAMVIGVVSVARTGADLITEATLTGTDLIREALEDREKSEQTSRYGVLGEQVSGSNDLVVHDRGRSIPVSQMPWSHEPERSSVVIYRDCTIQGTGAERKACVTEIVGKSYSESSRIVPHEIMDRIGEITEEELGIDREVIQDEEPLLWDGGIEDGETTRLLSRIQDECRIEIPSNFRQTVAIAEALGILGGVARALVGELGEYEAITHGEYLLLSLKDVGAFVEDRTAVERGDGSDAKRLCRHGRRYLRDLW